MIYKELTKMGQKGEESVNILWTYPKSQQGYSLWLPWAVAQLNPFCQSCQSWSKSARREPGSRCSISEEEVFLASVPKNGLKMYFLSHLRTERIVNEPDQLYVTCLKNTSRKRQQSIRCLFSSIEWGYFVFPSMFH